MSKEINPHTPKGGGIKQRIVIGVDEVGRGSLAGPVIACAVIAQQFSTFNFQFSKKLKDSKKLTPKKRKQIYEMLKAQPQVGWGIGRVGEKVIDKINIFEATKLAMIRAVKNLKSKIHRANIPPSLIQNLFLLLDGNFSVDLDIPQKSIIKGDEKVFLIKLASIIAKVTRDRAMLRYHKVYPRYGFDKHKGYGTKLHMEMIKKYGPSKLHRKTFRPVKSLKAANLFYL